MSRLKEKYDKKVRSQMMSELGIKNLMAVPRVEKVVINTGIGDSLKNKEILDKAKNDLASITGQYPSVRAAKMSVASFGVRKGMPVGLKVTLRGDKMYIFLDKLFSIVLPRLRDFRGVSKKSFDKGGNYTLGITEHTVFPEVDLAKANPRGLEVTIVMNTGSIEYSRKLLELLGMPFEKD